MPSVNHSSVDTVIRRPLAAWVFHDRPVYSPSAPVYPPSRSGTRSQHDERVAAWIMSELEGGETHPWRNREAPTKFGVCGDDGTIVSRVSDEQDHALASQVTLLGRDPTVERLKVDEAGLSLDFALQRVAERYKGPLSDEIYRMLREVGHGKTRREALADMV